MDVRKLTGRVLTALLGCAVLAGTGPVPIDDDLHILRELRPAQRENLVVVQRDGSIRLVAYDPVVQDPQIAALPAERGYTIAGGAPQTHQHLVAARAPAPHPPVQHHAVLAQRHVHVAPHVNQPQIALGRIEPLRMTLALAARRAFRCARKYRRRSTSTPVHFTACAPSTAGARCA